MLSTKSSVRIGFLAVILAMAVTVSVPAQANEYRCFGDETWCAWTIRESQPELGWGAISKVRLRSLVVETIIDARNNRAALRVNVSPVTPKETSTVNLSVREPGGGWQEWGNYAGDLQVLDDAIAQFVLNRSALEAVIEASPSAHLYVFVEIKNSRNNHKVSHKVALADLAQALQFARMGP